MVPRVTILIFLALLTASLASCEDAPNPLAPPLIGQDKNRIFINKRDIELYVEMMFAEDHKGFYWYRDHLIHRVAMPLNISIAWPLCETDMDQALEHFNQHSGFHITNKKDLADGDYPSMFLIGANNVGELKQLGWIYDMLTFTPFWTAENLEKRFKEVGDHPNIAQHFWAKPTGRAYGITLLIRRDAIDPDACSLGIKDVIFRSLTNIPHKYFYSGLDDLDFLFVNALYDPSIAEGEAEDSAKPKIIELMLDRLPHRQ